MEDRSDMKEIVYLKLKQMIMKREFTPNERIDALEIANKLGISRTPVRDALNMLESEGFIRVVPRQGIYVNGIYKKDLIELFEFRKMVELFSLETGFNNVRNNVQSMKDILTSVENSLNSENYDGHKLMNADINLHKFIVDATENRRIIDSYTNLNGHVQMARAYYLQDFERLRHAHDEHNKIIAGIMEGNKEETVKVLEEHLEHTLSNLLKMIDIYKVF
jgi:DNA-binding GntR family transcriptional regulator